jgi:hypothetical protein
MSNMRLKGIKTWVLKLSRLFIETLSSQINTPRLNYLRDEVFVEIMFLLN